MSDRPRPVRFLHYTLVVIGALTVLWVLVQIALIALTLFLWADDGPMRSS